MPRRIKLESGPLFFFPTSKEVFRASSPGKEENRINSKANRKYPLSLAIQIPADKAHLATSHSL
jgi:hypothetical protein